MASLLPAGSELLKGVLLVKASTDSCLTLTCPNPIGRADLLQALRASNSIRASPHLSDKEVAGLKLARNMVRSYGVRVINKGLACGFASL